MKTEITMSLSMYALLTFLALGTASAEPITLSSQTAVPIKTDSGFVQNGSDDVEVVYSTTVAVPDAHWLRLRFDDVTLAGNVADGTDAYLLLTSLSDGSIQVMNAVHLVQWRMTSAYFNGDAVRVEIIAHPQTGENRLVIGEATAGLQDGDLRSICGSTDDRTLSNDPRVARISPVGCTAWMIDDFGHCFLSAGHCVGSSFDVIEFNVPLSNGNGSWNHPPPSDQYVIDQASLQWENSGVGNDWAYFGCFSNSTTGLTPFGAQGDSFDLVSPPAVTGQTIRITGYGTVSSPVSLTWNSVQKTHAGPYVSRSGTRIQYAVDTTGGNSGSPVINEDTGEAIGIHTNAGCSVSGGANNGTGANQANLLAAISNPLGECVADCNANGVVDECDVDCGLPGCNVPGCGLSPDCNNNVFPDECDLLAGSEEDCNVNGVPDVCDIAPGGSGSDCNGTGIPDDCELVGNDCDGNLNPDECDSADLAASLVNPTSEALCAGNTVNFTVGAPPGSSYQWFRGMTALTNGGRITGATSSSLTITTVSAADEDDYYCEVDDACIIADSQSASLYIVPGALLITQEPVAQVIICTSSGQGAAFEMNVDNALAVTYQWYKDGAPLTNDSRISGATTNRIEISPVETGDLGFYTCHAENPCGGSVDTDPGRGELVVADPIYTTQPEDTCVSVGGATTFSVVADPSNTLLFWYRDGAQLANGTDGNGMVIAGATTDTLQLSNVPTAYDQSEFHVVGFNPNPVCQGDSEIATLTVGGCLPCCLAADVNCDGTADVLDLGVVRQGTNWNQSPPTGNPRADVTGDGVADVLDLGTIRQGANWNVSTGPCDCSCSQ